MNKFYAAQILLDVLYEVEVREFDCPVLDDDDPNQPDLWFERDNIVYMLYSRVGSARANILALPRGA